LRKKIGHMLILASAVFFLFTPMRAEAADSEKIMKIGLYYGTNALPSANLANEVGSGYDLGYYDSDRNFVKIHSISDEKITVMKNKTIYLAGDGLYYDVVPASAKGKIGAYHLQAGTSYPSAEEASAAAKAAADSCGYPAYPAYVDGSYVVRIGSFASADEASSVSADLSAKTGLQLIAVGMSATCYTVTVTGTTNILYEFDNKTPLGIRPRSDSSDSQAWFKGNLYNGGFEYNRISGNDITVVNVVNLSGYIKGVIPYEMNPSWSIEALKAQALCAKSYALSLSGKHRASGFDLCSTDDCQVYRGCSLATENSNNAVDAVDGLAVMYNGIPAQTVFHSSDGGSTEDAKNVWGSDVPYLKAVRDDFEDLQSATNGIWTKTITPALVTTILRNKGYDVSNIVSLYVDQYTDAGNVYSLSVKDSTGKVTSFPRESARTILNSTANGTYVYSMRFTINSGEGTDFYAYNQPISGQSKQYAIGKDQTVRQTKDTAANSSMMTSSGIKKPETNGSSSDVFTISGRGWGHNVGMSQWGAKGMAERGYTYDQILKYYYTGVSISNY